MSERDKGAWKSISVERELESLKSIHQPCEELLLAKGRVSMLSFLYYSWITCCDKSMFFLNEWSYSFMYNMMSLIEKKVIYVEVNSLKNDFESMVIDGWGDNELWYILRKYGWWFWCD